MTNLDFNIAAIHLLFGFSAVSVQANFHLPFFNRRYNHALVLVNT